MSKVDVVRRPKIAQINGVFVVVGQPLFEAQQVLPQLNVAIEKDVNWPFPAPAKTLK
ncbi:MAG: hypothetical protein R3E31_05390 [Chloroflexota bacterium]